MNTKLRTVAKSDFEDFFKLRMLFLEKQWKT